MVAPVMLLKGWPRGEVDQYCSTDSLTDVTPSLGDFVFNVGDEVFRAKDNTAVGYVSGFESSYYEVIEEALHLSHMLAAPVIGVHNEFYMPYGLVEDRIQAILQVWDRFFTKCPKGRFIQYGFEEGVRIVQKALAHSPYEAQVVIVGMNFHICPDRPQAYYFRNFTHLPTLCVPSMITIPCQGSAEGNFLLSITDPTWTSALQYTYYQTVGLEHLDSVAGLEDLNSGLELKREYPALLRRAVQLKMLAEISYARSSAVLCERLVRIALSVLRVIDCHVERHIVREVDKRSCLSKNSLFINQTDLVSTILESYWILHAASEMVLLCAKNHPVRRIALILASTGFFWNVADITSRANILMNVEPECMDRPIEITLAAYGILALLYDLSVGFTRIRQSAFKIADHCLCAMGINAKGTVLLGRIFRRNVRNMRALLSSLFMVCLGSCFLTRCFSSVNSSSLDWTYCILHVLFLLLFVPGSSVVLLSMDHDKTSFPNTF